MSPPARAEVVVVGAGLTGLPAGGMQSVGGQLVHRLREAGLRLHSRVRVVASGQVRWAGCSIRAHTVVVATVPDTAAALPPGVEATAPRQGTTHVHALPGSPWREPLIVLGTPRGRLGTMTTSARPRPQEP